MVYQDPYSSLNPRMKIGKLVGEAARVHGLEPPGKSRNGWSPSSTGWVFPRIQSTGTP